MVHSVKARLGAGYCVSVKIRIDDDLAYVACVCTDLCSCTDALVRNALHAGASLITIHGRTREQSSAADPVNLDGVRFAIEAANACGLQTAHGMSPCEDGGAGGVAPCVVTGDIWTVDDAHEWRVRTGARGAMSARGLLANPALFAGYTRTPRKAVAGFVQRAIAWGLPTALFQYVTHRFLTQSTHCIHARRQPTKPRRVHLLEFARESSESN